jgi:hypothetical protein
MVEGCAARTSRLLVLMKKLQGEEERPVVAPGIDALDGEDRADIDDKIDKAYTKQQQEQDKKSEGK